MLDDRSSKNEVLKHNGSVIIILGFVYFFPLFILKFPYSQTRFYPMYHKRNFQWLIFTD